MERQITLLRPHTKDMGLAGKEMRAKAEQGLRRVVSVYPDVLERCGAETLAFLAYKHHDPIEDHLTLKAFNSLDQMVAAFHVNSSTIEDEIWTYSIVGDAPYDAPYYTRQRNIAVEHHVQKNWNVLNRVQMDR
ncbi:hypothetical protein H0H87_002314, partial [Tephrocybe sp. NHM501043]